MPQPIRTFLARGRAALAVVALVGALLTAQSPAGAESRLRYDDHPIPSGDAQEFDAIQAWNHTNLTYFFSNGTNDITGEQQAIRDAMALWAAVSPLTFTEVGSAASADILFLFATGNHGDGYPFDGVNAVLAHAFFPPPNGSLAGDAHFDDAETWTDLTRANGAQPIDLVTVAAHELGHSLGLGHSNVSGALMYAFYGGSHRFLHQDDIDGIQFLYPGGGGGTPTISIADRSIVEGNSGRKSLRFTVSLSAASSQDVTVLFTTSNGSAVAPSDYRTKSVTVKILAGKTSKPVAVVVNGDVAVEPNETFTVTLTNPVGGTIGDGTATGTITNDD